MNLQSLFRFTKRDEDFQKRLAQLTEKRESLDERAGEIFKATLDHEGEWFLTIIRRNPECALRVAADCVSEKK